MLKEKERIKVVTWRSLVRPRSQYVTIHLLTTPLNAFTFVED